MFGFSAISIIIYLAYPILLVTISVGISVTRDMDLTSYFFSPRKFFSFIIGISFFASLMLSPFIFGVVKITEYPILFSGYISLIFVLLYFIGQRTVTQFSEKKTSTLGEFLTIRFNQNTQTMVSMAYLLFSVPLRLLLVFVAGNFIISSLFGIEGFYLLFFLLIVTGLYLIIGGIEAEYYAGIIQSMIVLLVVSALVIFQIYFPELSQGTAQFSQSSLFETTQAGVNGAVPGMLLAMPLLAFWFWCADKIMIQRVFKRDTNKIEKRKISFILILQMIAAAIFSVLTLIYFTLPGEVSKSIATGVMNKFPEQFMGFLLLAIVSVVMSTLANLMNSTSAVLTFDFYKIIDKGASDMKLLLIARMAILIPIMLSLLIIPIAKEINFTTIYLILECLFYSTLHLSTIFVFSLFNRKLNSAGALITLVAGVVFILAKLIWFSDNLISLNDFSGSFYNGDFHLYSLSLIIFSTLLMLLFSALYSGEKQKGLKTSGLQINLKSWISKHILLLPLISPLIMWIGGDYI